MPCPSQLITMLYSYLISFLIWLRELGQQPPGRHLAPLAAATYPPTRTPNPPIQKLLSSRPQFPAIRALRREWRECEDAVKEKDLDRALNGGSPVTEVEPYIPFNINPSGMQPVLTASYLLAFPSIMAGIFGSSFWENVKDMLNPHGAQPWVFYSVYALFVFLFNIFDIANLPKEIADYTTKIGARIPNIKPGKATIEHLTKIQASTRFWGGLLLCILATSSSLLDRHLRQINEGLSVGFTSVLIIVGSIIELRRSYQAYNVMPSLSKVLKRYGV